MAQQTLSMPTYGTKRSLRLQLVKAQANVAELFTRMAAIDAGAATPPQTPNLAEGITKAELREAWNKIVTNMAALDTRMVANGDTTLGLTAAGVASLTGLNVRSMPTVITALNTKMTTSYTNTAP
jgi:hypothetical protein